MEGDPAGVGFFVALWAGLVSFLSPCVLPLVPGYLSAVSGVGIGELERGDWRRVLAPSLIFIFSFSLVFIALGLAATGVGEALRENQQTLTEIGGVVMILMGLLFVGSFFAPRLNREWRVDALIERAGQGGPVIAGLAFAIAWSPCVGPTLGSILTLAAIEETPGEGAFLLAVYSLGLGIPFLLTALAFSRMTSAFAVVKRHYGAVIGIGGVILIAMGVLFVTGEFFRLNIEAQKLTSELGLNL
ncbi:MAG: cytochrome c biogenesis CcdA family protein [Solirubrobacterales bacterium]